MRRWMVALVGTLAVGLFPAPTAALEPAVRPAANVIAEAETVDDILRSTDYTQADTDILRLYQAFFARLPDAEGTRYWIGIARSGRSLDAIAGWFADSAEFQLTYSAVDDRRFLEIVYGNVLGRGYDQAGFEYWLQKMQTGLSRGGVVRWVAANAEFVSRHPFTPVNPAIAPASPWWSSGQYLIGNGTNQIPSGRYMMLAAKSGCYWERQRGLGGTTSEIIANDFVADPSRRIIDIQTTDLAIEFNAKCGRLRPYIAAGQATSLGAGVYLVGSDAVAGTYVAQVQSGCYWERTRDFSDDFRSIIANDFIASAGQHFVAIQAGEGFTTNADCGTWQRVG